MNNEFPSVLGDSLLFKEEGVDDSARTGREKEKNSYRKKEGTMMKNIMMAALGIIMACFMGGCQQESIATQIEEMNERCPWDMGNGLTLEKAAVEGNTVVYTLTIDETQMGVEEFNLDDPVLIPIIKSGLVAGFKNAKEPSSLLLKKLMKKEKMNLSFVLRTLGSGQEAEVGVSYTEL